MIVCLRKDVSDRRDTKTHTIYWEIFAPILILPLSPSLLLDDLRLCEIRSLNIFLLKKALSGQIHDGRNRAHAKKGEFKMGR